MSDIFQFTGEIKKQFLLGSGVLEFSNNGLSKESGPRFRVNYLQNNDFTRRKRADFLNVTRNITEISYSKLLENFISSDENQFRLFKKTRTFITDFKNINEAKVHNNGHKVSTKIYDDDNNYLEGQTYFEFKSLWTIEQLFFKQLYEAILLYKRLDEEGISNFLYIKKDKKKGFYLESKIYSKMKSSLKYKNAFSELNKLKMIQKKYTEVSFLKDDRKFLQPDDFLYFYNEENEDNIKNKKIASLKDLENFIYDKINFLINISIKVQLTSDNKSIMAKQETLGLGMRGILTYLCMNLLKTTKGSLKCKLDGCEKTLTIKIGRGKKSKLFCSDKCKSQYFYSKKLEENILFSKFKYYGFDKITKHYKPFDAVISGFSDDKKKVVSIFTEYSKMNHINKDKVLGNEKLFRLIKIINKNYIDSYYKSDTDLNINNLNRIIYFLHVISYQEGGTDYTNYKYYYPMEDSQWGFFESSNILLKSQLFEKLEDRIKIKKIKLA